jgi:hypothetical protein
VYIAESRALNEILIILKLSIYSILRPRNLVKISNIIPENDCVAAMEALAALTEIV